ncbi:GNAT family N-acetyltransferase [Curvivirga sp.]|uniref:GNAT family N-acetyltransferase n=1 Tax=Curvivirga sp. TaxID=2856848 RepID=UPI003B5A158D
MTDTYSIRPTELSDIPAITEIYAHHVAYGSASFEEEPPSAEEMTRRYNLIQSKNQPYYVVESNKGEIMGYCYAGSFRERNAYRFTIETTLYLKPGAEGHGLGGLMLDTLIEECSKRGYRQMVAVIGDSANAGSIGVHKSRGFNMIGTMPGTGFKHGRWVDTVMMQRPVNGGDLTLPE